MGGTLVIRFGALGDLCITAWFLAGLAETDVPRPLTLATKAVHAPLAGRIPGVDRVLPLDSSGIRGLWSLAGKVRAQGPEQWLDAHAVLRSRLLSVLCLRRPDATLRKDTLDRWRRIRRGDASGRAPALLDRLDALADGSPGRDRLADLPRPPLAVLRSPPAPGRRLGLAPGARWPTKRWPTRHVGSLLRSWLDLGRGPVTLLLGPDEADWPAAHGLEDLVARPEVEIVAGRPLLDVAAALGGCDVVVTNDSGLLHLSEAVGTPVVALFGPTVQAFGYAPLLPRSRLLEADLDCRPCSRTGSRPCHRGDLACLEMISPDAALEAVLHVLDPDGKGIA